MPSCSLGGPAHSRPHICHQHCAATGFHHLVAEGGLGLLGVLLRNIKHPLFLLHQHKAWHPKPELYEAEAHRVTRLARLLLSQHPGP